MSTGILGLPHHSSMQSDRLPYGINTITWINADLEFMSRASYENLKNIIGSDNGLSPARHQAIIWTNAEILLIGPLRTKFSELLIGIYKFS